MSTSKVLIINSSDHDNRDNLGPIEHILQHPVITSSITLSQEWSSYQNARARFELSKPSLVIMSGRNYLDSPSTIEEAKKWYGWINDLEVPVFTICGSYQRWVMSLDAQIIEGNPEVGLTPTYLRNHQEDYLHNSYDLSRTYIHNHHRYYVDNRSLPQDVVLLGHTLEGTSIVKHISKPIYGFQGHPEKAFSHNSSYEDQIAQEYSTLIFRELLNLS